MEWYGVPAHAVMLMCWVLCEILGTAKVTFCSSTVLHFIHYLLSFPSLLPFPLLIACSLTILQLIPFFSYIFGSLYKFASVGLKIHIYIVLTTQLDSYISSQVHGKG